MKRNLLLAAIAATALAGLATTASATTVNFTTSEAPGVTCCGLMASNAYAAFGLTVADAYWYADGRDTFDGQGISIFTSPATITFAAVTSFVEFQYWVIGGHRGTYEALDSTMASLGSFVVNASQSDLLGTHIFNGDVKSLKFSGDSGYTQVSAVTFDSAAVPEPTSLLFLSTGLVALLARRSGKHAARG